MTDATQKGIRIAGTWAKVPDGYAATGTKGESITLRRTHSPSYRVMRWHLTVTPVDGDPKSVELGARAVTRGVTAFDHVEALILAWDVTEGCPVSLENTPSYRPRNMSIPDGSDVAHRHMSGAHAGVIECASNGNVLDLRCQPGYRFETAPSGDDPTLVRVWLVRS